MGNPFQWPFLNEPIWRWFLFLVVIGALMTTWAGVLRHIKAAT